MKRISLTQGKVALVDDADFDRLNQWKWCAQIQVNKKPLHLGVFLSETKAALAYDRAARTHFGEFARTNF